MIGTRLTPLGKLVLLVAVLGILGMLGAGRASATRPHDQAWRCVAVGPGDTLWALAQGAGGDTRATVHAIVEHNSLASASLTPGTTLWVPIEADRAKEAVDAAACGGHPR